MDNRREVREFLASRRAKITPQQAGLPAYGGHRRVPGLRREEVAMLAGVSAEYYARLERGNLGGVSESVLESLARALQLDEAEHAHLFDLARTANATPRARRRRAQQQIRPGIQHLLDSMTDTAAYVRNGRLDIVASNRLGRALYSPVFDDPVRPVNLALFRFLSPRARDFYPDWEESAHTTVALLRTEAGRDPYDRPLTDLIGELATRSEDFRTRWAAHNVRLHHTGVKNFHHPVVGDLTLPFEAMPLPADPGLTLTAFSAEPGTPAHDALSLLAAWAATSDRTRPARPEDQARTSDG
ncbi:helix-turn-helix transcriptional regulator [Actinoallomurus rhizosphaericola]|uniref:helix-turn-helix transcriptional regulator n=1 Tax=Actinoallomurus rhizosphaericola TaxID=2952536 RepID=UPI002093CD68|nr:helix-turn-helix transcriptional regulator [Actinoallomurus rhizosphaericola]MCO5996892.1 helix-turn-helix transcriptional regulator [Actinoallomurus rhizosphaericola]